VDTEVLTKLGQAEVALLALKQGLEKSRLMQQVVSNLSEVQQRHHLH
jgi:cytochrome c553